MFREVIRAEKIAALAISENGFGSDVANLETTARRDGDYYIVKWEEKKKGGGGRKEKRGKIKIIVELSFACEKFNWKENEGFKYIMLVFFFFFVENTISFALVGQTTHILFNFNQERFGIGIQAAATARMCLVEAVQYARERVVFKQPLINSQVIRHKCAEMARKILSTYALMEKIASQMNNDPLGENDTSIPTNVALFKVQATKTCEFCAREASQIFGGKSYVLGSKIDRMYRDVRAFAIYGFSFLFSFLYSNTTKSLVLLCWFGFAETTFWKYSLSKISHDKIKVNRINVKTHNNNLQPVNLKKITINSNELKYFTIFKRYKKLENIKQNDLKPKVQSHVTTKILVQFYSKKF
ncbi:acyl-CoA dehydrogenase [Reticulomyxa filosa]|uniref:Acyl-CoA dehydrogenase n=1 Tax=Reticulomyxa filosa TaxID=46433 RepID=X6MZU1_RETFI|nr:acyl-CoA dehydrogenase [Reticulomyxa filosa]|eukprot:ETO18994.1 acyl-CoA dehydrogenase [Reticulomyxa filosa]